VADVLLPTLTARKSRIQLQREVFSPRLLNLEETMVLNAEQVGEGSSKDSTRAFARAKLLTAPREESMPVTRKRRVFRKCVKFVKVAKICVDCEIQLIPLCENAH
jgi:hypothetical protein